MHGKDVALRQHEVHDAEDGFLHLAGVFRAADEHQLLGEVDQHKHFGVGAVALGVGKEAGRAHDGELRLVSLELFGSWADEQLPHKQVVPGILVDHLNGELILRVGATKEVLNKQLLVLQVVEDTLIESVELFRWERLVYGAPRDLVLRDRVLHRELVFGRTAGAFAGFSDQRAARCKYGFAATQCRFHQLRGRQVAVYFVLRKQLRYFGSLYGGGHKGAPCINSIKAVHRNQRQQKPGNHSTESTNTFAERIEAGPRMRRQPATTWWASAITAWR